MPEKQVNLLIPIVVHKRGHKKLFFFQEFGAVLSLINSTLFIKLISVA